MCVSLKSVISTSKFRGGAASCIHPSLQPSLRASIPLSTHASVPASLLQPCP